MSLPRRAVLVVAVLLIVWFGVDGAETVMNDRVLIAGQQEEVSHLRLARPHSLSSWLAWRGPAYGFQHADSEAVDKVSALDGEFVYLSGSLPDPRVAALMAVASGRPFSGWARQSDGPAVSRGCALYLFTGKSDTLKEVGLPWVAMRGQEPVPTRSETLSEEFVVIHLEGEKGEPRSVDSVLRAEIEKGQPHEVPAASLVGFRILLQNPTEYDLDLSRYRGVRFAPTFPNRQPLRPIDFPVAPLNLDKLPAGESVAVVAYLRTSIYPLDYQLGIQLTLADGTYQPVPMAEIYPVRSWRVELPLDYPFKEEKS